MKIINPPKPIAKEAYDVALSQYVERAKQASNVRAILTMGSVGAPGLSDLDVIVVVDDEFQPEYAYHLATDNINKDIFIHGPIVIPISMVNDLQYIIYASNVTSIYGETLTINFDTLPAQDLRLLRLAYLIDFTEGRLAQYQQVVDTGIVEQRPWMTRLWSITHSEHLCSQANITLSPQAQQVLGDIRSLRSSWIEESVVDDTIFEKAFRQFGNINKEIFTHALHQLYEGETTVQPADVSIRDKRISFVPHIEGCEHLRSLIHIGNRELAHYRILAHPKYAYHLRNYGLATIRGCDQFRNPILNQRATLVKKHWVWLRQHCRDADSMNGHLGLRPYVGSRTYRAILTSFVKQGIWTVYDYMNKPDALYQ